MNKFDELLTRGIANIIPGKETLRKLLESGKKLHIYLGIDPTATKIHLGHAVPLRKLQAFAALGHTVTLLIGDFTALIGDTSDKDGERPSLTSEQIEENFQTYKQQAEKIIDFSQVQVKYNSEWLKTLNFKEVIKLCQQFSVGDFVGRELIRKRLDQNKRVGLHELLYPVMQGYDSYILKTDIQIGGTDQTFNMQAGRTLIKDFDNRESFVLANEFLIGTDGRKMSKSWENAIWLNDAPDEMYGKVMAITDDIILPYYILGTNVPMERVKEIEKQLENTDNPMPIKKSLAHQIVSELYDINAADVAAEDFENRIQKKELPKEVATVMWDKEGSLVDFLAETGLTASRSDAKRLIEQGGVTLDGNQLDIKPNEPFNIEDDQIIGVGKRKFVRIKKSS